MWTTVIILSTAFFLLSLPRPRVSRVLVSAAGGGVLTMICLSPVTGVGLWMALKLTGVTAAGVKGLTILSKRMNRSPLLSAYVRPWTL
jgi:uncharacterized membrane protein SirB2